jgi:hypothetical protein
MGFWVIGKHFIVPSIQPETMELSSPIVTQQAELGVRVPYRGLG